MTILQTTLSGLLLQREYAIASKNEPRLHELDIEIARLKSEIASSAVNNHDSAEGWV